MSLDISKKKRGLKAQYDDPYHVAQKEAQQRMRTRIKDQESIGKQISELKSEEELEKLQIRKDLNEKITQKLADQIEILTQYLPSDKLNEYMRLREEQWAFEKVLNEI